MLLLLLNGSCNWHAVLIHPLHCVCSAVLLSNGLAVRKLAAPSSLASSSLEEFADYCGFHRFNLLARVVKLALFVRALWVPVTKLSAWVDLSWSFLMERVHKTGQKAVVLGCRVIRQRHVFGSISAADKNWLRWLEIKEGVLFVELQVAGRLLC